MESLKKVIPLSQASKISGYHPDYLGFLIRKGELKGKKVGRSWFTTEQEVKNYMLHQKMKQHSTVVWDFFSVQRTRKIFFIGVIVAILGISFMGQLIDSKAAHSAERQHVVTTLSSETEVLINKTK